MLRVTVDVLSAKEARQPRGWSVTGWLVGRRSPLVVRRPYWIYMQIDLVTM